MPGGWELIAILAVVVVLFGAKKLPGAARSVGQSMRIFKAETKGMHADDQPGTGEPYVPPTPAALPTPAPSAAPVPQPAPQPGAQQQPVPHNPDYR